MMAIEIEQLIKILLGIFVVVVVVGGIYLIFRNQIFDFFKGLSAGKQMGIFLVMLK